MKNKILSVREQIADVLRSDIISGTLKPNTKLNEHQLASRFGTSRGPIRDVLLKLTKEGLLVSKNNVGSSVSSPLSPQMQKLSIKIRRTIEEFAINEVAGSLEESDFAALDSMVDYMQSLFEKEEFTDLTKADIAFHQYIVEKAGGDDLVNLWYPIVMRMRMNYQRIRTSQALVDEHRNIIEALKDENNKAAIIALKKNIK